MKVKPGALPQFALIILGIFFSCALRISSILELTVMGYVWVIVLCSPWILGWWQIVSFEISDHIVVKTNLGGLVRRSWDLRQVVSLEKKNVNNDFVTNPLAIVRLFSSNPRYFKFQIAKVRFAGGSKLRISEIGMEAGEFNKIYKMILKYEKANRN